MSYFAAAQAHDRARQPLSATGERGAARGENWKRELGSASRTQQRLKRTRRKPGGGDSVSPDRRRHHHQVVCAPSSFAHKHLQMGPF